MASLLFFALAMEGKSVFGFSVGNLEVGGYIRNETSLRYGDDTVEPLWCENILQVELTYHLIPDRIDLFLMTRGYYDAVYDMKDGGWLGSRKVRSSLRDIYQLERPDTQSDWLREAYIDFYLPKLDIRLGKQQIVWGKTEAFKMLDIINPTDYRHFTQDAFEDSRITLWAARFTYSLPFKTPSFLEFVALPDFEPNFAPAFGHPFVFRGMRASEPGSARIINQHHGWTWDEFDLGGRFGQNFGDWDYTIDYFHHWNRNPIAKLERLFPLPKVYLRYPRTDSIGGSFAKNFNSLFGIPHWVIRFETVFNLRDVGTKWGTAYTMKLPGGRKIKIPGAQGTRTDNFNYCLAIDHRFHHPKGWWGPAGMDYTFQIFQTYILDYDHDFVNSALSTTRDTVKVDRYTTLLTSTFMTSYLQSEVLKPFLLVAYVVDDGAWWISPQISYELTEKTMVTLGTHIFTGPADTFIGQMNKLDNVFLRIKFGI